MPATAPPRWAFDFGLWEISQVKRQSRDKQAEVASALAGERITYEMLRTLRANPRYQQYLTVAQESAVAEARARAEAGLPKMIDAHLWAVEAAQDQGDYRAMAPLTSPAWDRVMPKTEARPQTNIQIVLSPKQQAAIDALDAEPQVLDAEIIDAELDDSAG